MGILTLSIVFLVAFLQGECDTSEIMECPPGSTSGEVSPCALTCGNVDNRPAGECPEKPVPGCVCDDGLYAQTGTCGFTVECVDPKCCNATCGPNKTYQSVAQSCPATCEDPDLPQRCRPLPLPQCACNEGYLLKDNYCVLPEQC
ncbi:SCO-spondin-like [Engystomops pustulosus]|uniref:SCO-spondin-like n=1 Tax=Engystomops pustulosus TaxID=76066 RepID=UPI003AFB04D0